MKTKARKVRNVLLLALALVLVLGSCLALFGCGGDDSGSTKGADYTITFDENYSGGSKTKVGVYAGEYEMPVTPTREGYMFTGWYADKDATTEAVFDEITKNTTVYAGWLERKEGMVYVTLYYNLTGGDVYKAIELESGSRMSEVISTNTPSMSGYKFKGWYEDATCTTAASSSSYISEDKDLYASWYKGWTFEAELTNLLNSDGDDFREFQGYSQNGDPFNYDSSASNGCFIGDMYVNECYIEFEITCAEAVDDAQISIRAAMEYGWYKSELACVSGNDVVLTSNDYKVIVNGKTVDSATMTFSGAAALTKSGQRTAFAMYDLSTVSLNAGSNTIRLQVANTYKGEGGTEAACAPAIDYMMVYVPTGIEMSMKEYDNVVA